MPSKYKIRKPTHELVHDGIRYALVRCGQGNGAAIQLLSTGETERSASFLADCDLLMGRWKDAVWYMFGEDSKHIPEEAKLVAL